MIDSGDLEGAKKYLEQWHHAYFYAPGMNEHVITLSDTRAAGDISALLRHMKDPEEAKRSLKSFGNSIVSEWKEVVKKYSWQKGLTAEKINQECRLVWDEASSKGGDRLASKAMQSFWSGGPEAARKVIEKAKPKK